MTDERRTVLKVLAGCAAAGAAGVSVVPALALIGEPSGAQGSDAGQWIRVARLDALQPGQPVKAAVVGTEVDAWTRAPDRRLGAVWLVRDGDAAVRAYSAVCPHLGCAIDLAADHRFFCPCHDSYFAPNGDRQTGPSPRGMDPLEVRITPAGAPSTASTAGAGGGDGGAAVAAAGDGGGAAPAASGGERYVEVRYQRFRLGVPQRVGA